MVELQRDELVKMDSLKPLAGKVAVVTGASKGIGAEIAKVLARNGALVVGNYLSSPSAMEDVLKEIEQEGGTSFALKADVQ